jgi:hypothetical protein
MSVCYPQPAASQLIGTYHAHRLYDHILLQDQAGGGSVQEVDLSEYDPRQPSLTFFSTGATCRWGVLLYTPIYWFDKAGDRHEASCTQAAWRQWSQSIGSKAVESWRELGASAADVLIETTIVNEQKSHNHFTHKDPHEIEFTPDECVQPVQKVVEDTVDVNTHKTLGDILPEEAKDAEYVVLKWKFFREPLPIKSGSR